MKLSVKKFAAFIVAMAMLLSTATAAARSSLYLSAYRAWLSAGDNGAISVVVDVQARDDMDEVGASRIQLLESRDGGENWTTVKIYLKSIHPEMVKTNDYYYCDIPVTYSGTAGYQYYAIVTIYAGDSTGSDTRNYVTDVVTAKP